MKKVLCIIIVSVILCSILLDFTSCNENNTKNNEKLKYYTTNSTDSFSSLIKNYNKYCLTAYDESYQIDIVAFENKDDMNTKISTEIMAGKGPDIFSLKQEMPFEKMIENNSFLDINTLISNDKSEDKIDLNKYNRTVMDSGVFDGKRYIIPLYYGVDVLVTTQERLNQFDISLDNGEALTYSNLSKQFTSFFNSDTNYIFISNDSNTDLWFDHPMQLFSRFLNNYVDFENKITYFDTNEFSSNLDIMTKIVRTSNCYTSNVLFDDLYINRSLTLITGNYFYYNTIGETPIVCRGMAKNENDYSGYMQIGFAINANTAYEEQAYAFIKYVLSEDVQMSLCGAKGNSYSASIAFPVNKNAYEQSKLSASNLKDDNDEFIGIDNDFVGAYMEIAENINQCSLYMDVSHTYYNSDVIGDIADKYINGSISKDKFIRQLTAATEIYLDE